MAGPINPPSSPEEIKDRVHYYLQQGIDVQGGDSGAEDALKWIARLYSVLGGNFPDTPSIREFKRDVVEKVKSGENPYRLGYYIFECFNYAGDWEANAYSIARYMRSLIQLFSDEFIDIDHVVLESDRGQIEEIDEMLTAPRADIDPLREVKIPDWVPESHWWWRTGRTIGDVPP